MNSVILSAVIIFLILCFSAFLAFIVPLEETGKDEKEDEVETDSVLGVLVKSSKNIPPVVAVLSE